MRLEAIGNRLKKSMRGQGEILSVPLTSSLSPLAHRLIPFYFPFTFLLECPLPSIFQHLSGCFILNFKTLPLLTTIETGGPVHATRIENAIE